MERILQKIGRIREYQQIIRSIQELRLPQSYAEAFDVLGENHVLEPEFAYEFSRIAGFRNFLAHDYEKIDASFICEQIPPKLEDIDRFLEQIEHSCPL